MSTKNEKAIALGGLIGSLLGAISTGVCVYFTGSIWSATLGVIGYLIGSWIGKSVK